MRKKKGKGRGEENFHCRWCSHFRTRAIEGNSLETFALFPALVFLFPFLSLSLSLFEPETTDYYPVKLGVLA